jgi:hypothetical protein
VITMYKLSLAKRDVYLTNVYDEIKKKKKVLFDKYHTVRENERNNEFLSLVKKDYEGYYNYILEEKERQVQAMSLISRYIDNIIVDGKLSDEDLQKSRQDQEKILHEIGSIKKGIDKLMDRGNETSNVTEMQTTTNTDTEMTTDIEDDDLETLFDVEIEPIEPIALTPDVDVDQ